jgi:hypothetical protein
MPLDQKHESRPTNEGPKFEFYYVDQVGRLRDAELWDEILGKDDQDTIELDDLPDAPGKQT